MKIAVLASRIGVYANKRFREAAIEKGFTVVVLDLSQCYITVSKNNPKVFYRGGEEIKNIDAVIPRIEPETMFFGTAVLRQFEMSGVYSLNSSLSIVKARDKFRSLQLLAKQNIPMPSTGFANSPLDSEAIIDSVGGAPLIVKLIEGTEGEGVVLTETKSAARSVVGAFRQLNANIMVQEYIKESAGRDIRCFVIGDEVVASMERIAPEGEFRANFDLGAKVQEVEITKEEEEMSIKAAKALGLCVAGVDLLRSNHGPLVLEVNSSPGFEGIEKATGKDIALMMIKYIEETVD